MTDFVPLLDQAGVFYGQHAPAALQDATVPAAILCLIGGVAISVLGARFARFGTTFAFAGAGAVIGHYFAGQSGFPPPLCVAGGAIVLGIIAFQTFRLWVGVVTAILFATVALGAFGYQRVLPHVETFEQTAAHASADAVTDFAPPTPREQEAYRNRTPKQWLQEFWTFITAREPGIERSGRSLTLAALLTGLCLGVVAVRWALIFSTALVGTGLVVTSIATLLSLFAQQEFYQAFQRHPNVVGMAVGGFLLSSIILQTMLTRTGPARAKSKPSS